MGGSSSDRSRLTRTNSDNFVNNNNIQPPHMQTMQTSTIPNNDEVDQMERSNANLDTSTRFSTSGRPALFTNSLRGDANTNGFDDTTTFRSTIGGGGPMTHFQSGYHTAGRESFSTTNHFGGLDDFDTSDAGLARMFEALDLDHDNVLSYDEICRVVESISIQKNLSTWQIQSFMNSFDQFTSITLEEFKSIVLSFMVSVYQSQQQEMGGTNYQSGFEEIIVVDYFPNNHNKDPVFMYVEKGDIDPMDKSNPGNGSSGNDKNRNVNQDMRKRHNNNSNSKTTNTNNNTVNMDTSNQSQTSFAPKNTSNGAWYTPRAHFGDSQKSTTAKNNINPEQEIGNSMSYQQMEDDEPPTYSNAVRSQHQQQRILKNPSRSLSHRHLSMGNSIGGSAGIHSSRVSRSTRSRRASSASSYNDDYNDTDYNNIDYSSRLNKDFFKSISFADLLAQPTVQTDAGNRDRVRWISIIGIDPAIILLLANKYSIHHLVVEDILGTKNERSKIDSIRGIVHILLPFIFVETMNYAQFNDSKNMNNNNNNKGFQSGSHTNSVMQKLNRSFRGKENKLKFHYGSRSQPELVKEKCHLIFIKEANTVIYITKEKTQITDLILSRINLASSKIRLNNVEFLIYSMIDALLDQTYDSMEFLMRRIRELKDDHKHVISKFSQLHAMAHLTREIEVLGMWIKPLQPVVMNVSNRFLQSARQQQERSILKQQQLHQQQQQQRENSSSSNDKSDNSNISNAKNNMNIDAHRFSLGDLNIHNNGIYNSNLSGNLTTSLSETLPPPTPGGIGIGKFDIDDDDELRQHYSDLLDNTISLWDECQMVVQWANSVNEEFKTFNDFRTNRILYILTILGSLVIPCQTLAAIYGMNFNSPDFTYLLDMDSGFSIFWISSLGISAVMLFSFKAAGWI